MTGKERLICALEGGTPDHVPVTWELVDRCALAFTGTTGWRAQCDAHRMIGSDILNLQGVGPAERIALRPGYSDETVQAGTEGPWEVSQRTLTTPAGTLTARTLHGGMPHDPLVHKITQTLVKTRDDYEIYADYLDECARTVEYVDGNSSEAVDYVGEDGLVNWWVGDSVYHIAMLRDVSELLIDLVEAPELMETMFAKARELTQRRILAFNDSAAEALVFDLCWASTSLLSPEMTRRFIVPEAQWVVRNVASSKYVIFFVSGKMWDVLAMLVDTGPHAIEHLDVLGDVDLREAKALYGGRTCLMGNYSPVVLAHGSEKEARAEALRCLDAAGPDRFIISTSDEVPADAKLENMRAAVDEANKWRGPAS